MDVISIRTPGLGDATYLLTHRGQGLLVDPQRDVDRFMAAADAAGVRLRYVLETHLHNDYISGGQELSRRSGADLVLPAAAVPAYDHIPAFHGEEFSAGAITVRPLHTPGHTPEHTSYLVLLDGRPAALFTGGSLLVGSAGRPDLLGMERARQLALAQYRSVQRLAALPDDVGLYPTHGEGSFCTASSAGRTTSTIGAERRENPIFRYADAEAFVRGQLAGLVPYPKYYAHMGPANLFGAAPMPPLTVPELTPAQADALRPEAWVVDARPREAFAAGHIPGAMGIELADDFGVWAGWVLPFNSPLVLALAPEQDAEEALRQLGRIGFDQVRGVLRDMAGWQAAGLPLERYETIDVDGFARAVESGAARQVLDVRAPGEWNEGHIEGSLHRYVPDLMTAIPAALDPAQPLYVGCASGYRATIAAGILQRAGYRPVVLERGGIPDVLERLPATQRA